jgi:hypothetical protein
MLNIPNQARTAKTKTAKSQFKKEERVDPWFGFSWFDFNLASSTLFSVASFSLWSDAFGWWASDDIWTALQHEGKGWFLLLLVMMGRRPGIFSRNRFLFLRCEPRRKRTPTNNDMKGLDEHVIERAYFARFRSFSTFPYIWVWEVGGRWDNVAGESGAFEIVPAWSVTYSTCHCLFGDRPPSIPCSHHAARWDACGDLLLESNRGHNKS